MSSLSHPPIEAAPDEHRWPDRFLVVEVWASLAITAMWIAVAVAAVWGPDFVSSSAPGAGSTTIPSGVVVAIFACIGSWAVAKHGFGHRERT
jgi:hypothetical protein